MLVIKFKFKLYRQTCLQQKVISSSTFWEESGGYFLHFPTNQELGQRKGLLQCPCALRACSVWIPYTLLECMANSVLLSQHREYIYVQRCKDVLTELRCTLPCQVLSFIQRITSFERDTSWNFPHSVNPCTSIFPFNDISFPVFNSFLPL